MAALGGNTHNKTREYHSITLRKPDGLSHRAILFLLTSKYTFMKKVWEYIKSIFVKASEGIAADIAIDQAGNLMEESLNKFYEKHPKTCAALVASMYVWIDTSVEELADKSKTTIDDKAVDEAKKELEAFALAKGFTLTNLDAD